MLKISRQTLDRILKAVRFIERSMRNPRTRRARWQGRGKSTSQRWGKLDATLSAGSTATVSLWQKTGGGWDGWDEDSTENWEDCYAPPVQTGDIASGTFVLVEIINGRKVVTLAACPA